MEITAKEIYEKEVKAVQKEHDKDTSQKDIVSLLGMRDWWTTVSISLFLALSSLSGDVKKRLDYKEIVSQMGSVPGVYPEIVVLIIAFRTFIFAGHDTTAVAMAWLLYELSTHPKDQEKIRQEIFNASESGSFTTKDYDSLPFLNAAIKVILQCYS